MSLLVILRRWLGGAPPAPAAFYGLRGAVARAGGPAGSLRAAATLTGSVTRV